MVVVGVRRLGARWAVVLAETMASKWGSNGLQCGYPTGRGGMRYSECGEGCRQATIWQDFDAVSQDFKTAGLQKKLNNKLR